MYTFEHYDKYDPDFVKDLMESQVSVWMAAQWLSEKGYNVTVRKTNIRPSSNNMSEYADNGDIEIIQRIEVKRRKIDFTSEFDYPYKTVFVDVAHTFDNAINKPFAYIIINQNGTHCIVIKSETFKHWIKTQKHDRLKNRDRFFYECPIKLCKFYSFGEAQMKECANNLMVT